MNCVEINRFGQPCGAPRLLSGKHCFWHSPDPEIVIKREESRKRAGRSKSGKAPANPGRYKLVTVEDVRGLLADAINETVVLPKSIAKGRCIAYLASVILKALETGEIEERLKILEEKVYGRTEKT